MIGKIISVHSGGNKDLSKDEQPIIQVELDGIVNDHHRGHVRKCYEVDKQPAGSPRRNERQWSAVSLEELNEIATEMGISSSISPTSTGTNLCISGIPELSRLPKGSLLKFPSGAELIVEEYNPPCKFMSDIQGNLHGVNSTAFSKAAKLKRGVIGSVEAAGTIEKGDEVTVTLYKHPDWLKRST